MPEESLGARIGNWFLKPVYESRNVTYTARRGEDGQALKGDDGKTLYDADGNLPRIVDWNDDGTIDTLEAIGTGGAALALGGLAARKLYKRHKEKKQFSEDEKPEDEKKPSVLSNAVNKIADKAKEHPNISGAALGVGLAAAASRLVPEETKQKIKNALFSEGEKKKLSFPAKMAIGGVGLATGVLVGDKFDVVDKSKMAVDKVVDYLKNLDIDWTSLDVSKDGSPIDEIGVAAGIPLAMYGTGKLIQNSQKVKSPDKNFSEAKRNKLQDASKELGLLGSGVAMGATLGAIGQARPVIDSLHGNWGKVPDLIKLKVDNDRLEALKAIQDKTPEQMQEFKRAMIDVQRNIRNNDLGEVYGKLKDAMPEVDTEALGDLANIGLAGSAIALAGAGIHKALKARKKGKEFSDESSDQIIVKNNIMTGAAKSSVIDAASKAITTTGKAGLTAGGAYAGYKYLDSKGYIPDELKKDVAEGWNKLTGGDISDLEGLVKQPEKSSIFSDIKDLRDAITQHGARIDSPLTEMIAQEKGVDPETFHSNIEEYGLAGAALAGAIMARKAWKTHKANKQKELNRNRDIAVAGIKQNQLNAERLLNRKSQKKSATQSIREKKGGY